MRNLDLDLLRTFVTIAEKETFAVAAQHVHRTQDGGQSWQEISPDLTLNDKSRQKSSGGLTGDNIGVEYAGVVYGIAESPVEKGLIWVGTNDGLVQLIRSFFTRPRTSGNRACGRENPYRTRQDSQPQTR